MWVCMYVCMCVYVCMYACMSHPPGALPLPWKVPNPSPRAWDRASAGYTGSGYKNLHALGGLSRPPPPTYIGWFVASSVAISFGSGAGLVDRAVASNHRALTREGLWVGLCRRFSL